jgi:hypothetical protein
VAVAKGATNFKALRKALLSEDYKAAKKLLSAKGGIEGYIKDGFKVRGSSIYFNGEKMLEGLERKIMKMVRDNDDPAGWLQFWAKLCLNPSKRSRDQLWAFLNHADISIAEDGDIIAYKSVDPDWTDSHTHTFQNKPGHVLSMPRAAVSDDPRYACSEGLHLGSKSFAVTWGSSNRRVIVCKVHPKDVVSVPYDASSQKMRVCRYLVVGLAGADLSETIVKLKDLEVPSVLRVQPRKRGEVVQRQSPDDPKGPRRKKVSKGSGGKKRATVTVRMLPMSPSGKKAHYKKMDDLARGELSEYRVDDLRGYMANHLHIVGAGHIRGGKKALLDRITKARRR